MNVVWKLWFYVSDKCQVSFCYSAPFALSLNPARIPGLLMLGIGLQYSELHAQRCRRQHSMLSFACGRPPYSSVLMTGPVQGTFRTIHTNLELALQTLYVSCIVRIQVSAPQTLHHCLDHSDLGPAAAPRFLPSLQSVHCFICTCMPN